jgi:hypothetical protein
MQSVMVTGDCVCRRDCVGYEERRLRQPARLDDKAHIKRPGDRLFEDAIRKGESVRHYQLQWQRRNRNPLRQRSVRPGSTNEFIAELTFVCAPCSKLAATETVMVVNPEFLETAWDYFEGSITRPMMSTCPVW